MEYAVLKGKTAGKYTLSGNKIAFRHYHGSICTILEQVYKDWGWECFSVTEIPNPGQPMKSRFTAYLKRDKRNI